jgi:hypothetical protein
MRSLHSVTLLSAALTLAVATSAGAQDLRPVTVGSRVKVGLVSPKSTVRGTVTALDDVSIALRMAPQEAAPSIQVALENVRRIEVSIGRRHPVGKSILLGIGIGGVGGALIGAVAPLCEPKEFLDCLFEPTTRGESVAMNALLMGTGGLVVGAVVGLVGHEAWAPGSVAGWRPLVAARPGGVAVGVAVRIGR